jgi:hypothetical protein
MKLSLLARIKQNDGELMASFGDARLVKKLSGKTELIGGTPEDRAEARECCSMIYHEAQVFPVA